MLHTRQHTHTRWLLFFFFGFNRNWVSHPVEARRGDWLLQPLPLPAPSSDGRTSTKLIKSNMIFLFVHMPLVSPFRLFIACHFSRLSSVSLWALSSVLCLRSPWHHKHTHRDCPASRNKIETQTNTIEMKRRILLVCLHMYTTLSRIRYLHIYLVNGAHWTLAPFPIHNYRIINTNASESEIVFSLRNFNGEREPNDRWTISHLADNNASESRCGRNVSNSRFKSDSFSNGFLFVFFFFQFI